MRENQKKGQRVPQVMICCSRGQDLLLTLCYTSYHRNRNGKTYPRSIFVRKYFVSCDAGVIGSGFGGTVLILMTNNSMEPLVIKASQNIAQIVFHKEQEVVFKKVDCLSSTGRRSRGFGLTGI